MWSYSLPHYHCSHTCLRLSSPFLVPLPPSCLFFLFVQGLSWLSQALGVHECNSPVISRGQHFIVALSIFQILQTSHLIFCDFLILIKFWNIVIICVVVGDNCISLVILCLLPIASQSHILLYLKYFLYVNYYVQNKQTKNRHMKIGETHAIFFSIFLLW